MDNKITQQYIDNFWDSSIIPTLCDYIRIPNKSMLFDPDWEKNGFMDQAMLLLSDWCKAHAPMGMQLEVLRDPGHTPLMYIEIPGTGDDTILFYGHMDKQPEMTGWHDDLGPWKPVIKNNKLYGRGAADDGYSVFAAITSILAIQEQHLPHSRCVIIIEASEESGSRDLMHYLEKLESRIGKPCLVIGLDSGANNYDQMWMTTSLRGNMVAELSVSVLSEGVHSGMGSGVAADSFRVIRELLSRIEDEKTGEILLKELQVNIPEDRIAEAKQCAVILGDEVVQSLPFQPGALPIHSDPTELLLNRSWRAALSITGVDGLPHLKDAGNVSRPFTALKLSMRIPPECDAKQAAEAIKKVLESNPPYGAKVRFELEQEAADGWNAPATAPWLKNAYDEASTVFFGQPTACSGEGGSIPFIGMMGLKFPQAQFIITGVLGPASNAHGPNEFLHIPMAKKLTACIASIVAKQWNS